MICTHQAHGVFVVTFYTLLAVKCVVRTHTYEVKQNITAYHLFFHFFSQDSLFYSTHSYAYNKVIGTWERKEMSPNLCHISGNQDFEGIYLALGGQKGVCVEEGVKL